MTEAHTSIGRVVDGAYDTLAFGPGGQPDWAAFAEVFDDRALLALRAFPDDIAISVMNLAEYAESQMRNDLESHGYSETPGERSIEVIGDVACVRQAFTMNFAHRAVDAVDVFLLSRTGGEWRTLAVVSDIAVLSPGS